jgi:restriction endonuclease S subunit
MNIKIPLPPIEEQRHIVAEIEQQLAAVEKAKQAALKQLAAAQALNAAYLREMFEGNKWETNSLNILCEDIFAGGDVPYGQFSKTKTSEYCVPVYTNGETNDGLFGYTNYARVTKESVTISARGTIGYTSIREAGYFPAIRLVVAIPKNNLDVGFLYYALVYNIFRKDGTSIPQLTVPMVKAIKIPSPPLDEQRRIIEMLKQHYEKAQKTIDKIQFQLETINAMPAAILREAFAAQGEN